jgi:hypothetical protein
MRAALLGIAALLLIGYATLAWVLPSIAGSDAKGAAEALLVGAEPAKLAVAAAAEKSGKLDGAGSGVRLIEATHAKHGRMKWITAENGAIRGWNSDKAMEITLTPTLQDGKASWSCRGSPRDAMPASCGGKS